MPNPETNIWPERWDLLLRYRLIEIVAFWEGRLTTRHLIQAFGIGRQQASKDINAYLEGVGAGNLVYDKFLKGYRPGPQFKPAYTRGDAEEYLLMLSARSDISESIATLDISLPNTAVVTPPSRIIRPEVVQAVVAACRGQKRLEIIYASLNNPVPDTRVIQPHTLVYNGYRWHVRAWCEKNRAFLDFVLTRIYERPELLTNATESKDKDVAWQTWVDIRLVPNPQLSPEQQALVRHDWGFGDDALVIKTRAALVTYQLQLLRVDKPPEEVKPQRDHLVVENLEELRPWRIE